MKRKTFWLGLAIVTLIMVSGLVLQAAATSLNKIEVVPGALSTRVIMNG